MIHHPQLDSLPPADHAAVPTTSPTSYLTGYAVLNLADPTYGETADWHQAGWRAPVDGSTREPHTINLAHEPTLRPIMELLKTHELHDYRPSLQQIGHPAGTGNRPVWGASHVRAILELAWEELVSNPPHTTTDALIQTVDPHTVARWLPEPMQWLKLHWWGWRIETGPARHAKLDEAWRTWRQHLTPYADHHDATKTIAWWLYPLCLSLAPVTATKRAARPTPRR